MMNLCVLHSEGVISFNELKEPVLMPFTARFHMLVSNCLCVKLHLDLDMDLLLVGHDDFGFCESSSIIRSFACASAAIVGDVYTSSSAA